MSSPLPFAALEIACPEKAEVTGSPAMPALRDVDPQKDFGHYDGSLNRANVG
jgi:hypothetical protein